MVPLARLGLELRLVFLAGQGVVMLWRRGLLLGHLGEFSAVGRGAVKLLPGVLVGLGQVVGEVERVELRLGMEVLAELGM